VSSQRPASAPPPGRVIRPRDKYLPHVISTASVLIVFLLIRRVVVSAEQWPRIMARYFAL
jgi:hypothetical protein